MGRDSDDKVTTVRELKERLAALPDEAVVYAYEGSTGGCYIVVKDPAASDDARADYLLRVKANGD